MDDIIVNQWTRMPNDCVVYDVMGNDVGKLHRTYGIRILEIGEEFIKIFSPDLNRNVYIRRTDLERRQESE